jgi:hypothetical protein
MERISEVEWIEARVNIKKKELTKAEEKEEKKEVPTTTLDCYFINNKTAESFIIICFLEQLMFVLCFHFSMSLCQGSPFIHSVPA